MRPVTVQHFPPKRPPWWDDAAGWLLILAATFTGSLLAKLAWVLITRKL